MTIGNILTKDCNSFNCEPIFKKVNDLNEREAENPTLIIGIRNAENYIEDFTILRKEYADKNVCWTFNKRDRRSDYINDITKFKKKCLESALKDIRYEYVDFTCYNLSRIKKFIKYLRHGDKKTLFLTKNSKFVFIYSEKYKVVWGLSLTLCEYIGIDRYKVIKRLKANKNNIFVYDLSVFSDDIRKFIGDNTHYILPIYGFFNN